ncbi:5'-adenylylsulfate reductase [Salix suchowensis]|nr:5'-adenylylsulfate reductase [Salix suchowensis]
MIKTYPSCCSRRSWQARFTTFFFFFFFFSISFHDQIKGTALMFRPEIAEKVELEGMTEDYGKLEKELEKASPLAIINKALQKFIDGSAISFRCEHAQETYILHW